jgi:hypothetical protein
MNKLFAGIPLIACMACAFPAQAMSYVPMPDAALLLEADAVIAGTVTSAGALPGQELQFTQYVVQTQQLVKGLLGQTVVVEVPGAFDPTRDGAATVPGAPHFTVGQQVLLFLRKLDDGNYAISELTLGAFTVDLTLSGKAVLQRNLAEANNACADCATEPAGSHRDLAEFTAWMRARLAGQTVDDHYWNSEALAPRLRPRFVTANPQARWFQFADGGTVWFYASNTGQAGMLDGGYLEFTGALLAWNTNLGSNIDYFYAGTSGANGGVSRADGVNEILFNDPNNELGGPYNCATGGMLAYTVFRTSGSGQFNGQTFQRITEADTVVRQGTACFLTGHLDADAAEVFGHELGHALGLAHPCGDAGESPCVPGTPQYDALMRPTMHADGRGASLRSDDQAGAAYLYARGVSNNTPPAGDTRSGGAGGGSGGGGGSWDAMALGMLLALFCLRRLRLAAPRDAGQRAAAAAWR